MIVIYIRLTPIAAPAFGGVKYNITDSAFIILRRQNAQIFLLSDVICPDTILNVLALIAVRLTAGFFLGLQSKRIRGFVGFADRTVILATFAFSTLIGHVWRTPFWLRQFFEQVKRQGIMFHEADSLTELASTLPR